MVLGHNNLGKHPGKAIDILNDLISSGNSKRSSWLEIKLLIDNDQGITVRLDIHGDTLHNHAILSKRIPRRNIEKPGVVQSKTSAPKSAP
jgi:hypothetical protein